MLTVSKAFYYISLEIGNLLIGWLGTIVYLTLSIMCVILARQYSNNFSLAVVIAVLAIICMAHMIDCILLVIGIIKKSHLFIVPWLFGQFLVTIISILFAIGAAFYFSILVTLCIDLVITVWVVIQLYLWICVYSVYEKIQYATNKKYTNLQENPSVCGGV